MISYRFNPGISQFSLYPNTRSLSENSGRSEGEAFSEKGQYLYY